MKKREFLAVGGAVPLMLAGCGGDSSGSAPVRLVNASVGYPTGLGFMVNSTQATTADVPYGGVSPFETVEAGSVTTAITVTSGSSTASVSTSTRTLSKDSRYSMIAYGFLNELKSLLLVESTSTPDAGKANVNVLNTSVDIGAVDVFLSPTTDLSVATQIASSVNGVAQSLFSGVIAGSYYITVVGTGHLTDIRFQTPTAITLTDQQIMTIVLTPGASGTLANAILLTQGESGGTASFTNATARVRAVSAIATGTAVSVVLGTTTILSTSTPDYSQYAVVAAGTTLPTVTVGGTPVTYTGTLSAGGDYTLMIYPDGSAVPTAKFILDDNTAPTTSTGVKFRLINLAADNQGLSLSMAVNSVSVASAVAYATASPYTEIQTPQNVNSTAEVFSGADLLTTHLQPMLTPNIFTDIVLSVDPSTGAAKDIFRSSASTI